MGLLDGRRRKHAHDITVTIPLVEKLVERMNQDDFPGDAFPFSMFEVEDILEEAIRLRDLDGLDSEKDQRLIRSM